jgi:hypothetical protein
MKRFATLAFASSIAAGFLFACSSDNSDDSGGGAGHTSSAGSGTAGSSAGSLSIGGGGSGAINTQGGNSTAGSATAGSSNGGSGTAGSGTGGASGGSSSNGGAANGGAANGGSAGGDNANAVVSTCQAQTYTPTATPGAACATKMVPVAKLISDFEAAGAPAGWGVYPNVDGMTGFTPATVMSSAGGANGTAKALAFTVTNLAQGIKIEVGFGTQCQDVRTFKGLSFWAKGSIDAATMPYAVDANTLVLQVGSETSALGGCQGGTCSAAPPDKRITISADWKEYRIPWDCFGDGKVFDGYYTRILFSAFGTNSSFAIDQVGYYQ